MTDAGPYWGNSNLPQRQRGYWNASADMCDQLSGELDRLSDHYQKLMAECDAKDAEIKVLQEKVRFLEWKWVPDEDGKNELEAENERLRAVVKLAGIHHHDGCKGCFAVQSEIRRLATMTQTAEVESAIPPQARSAE